MIIINGRTITDEQLVAALQAAGLLPEEIGGFPQINIVQEVPEGFLCAYCAGDIGYEGINVDLVDPKKLVPGTKYVRGVGLVTIENPDPAMHPDETGLVAYIYEDLSRDEYTQVVEYKNTEAAFSEE